MPDIVPTLCIAVDEAGRSAVDFSAVEEEYSALADEEDDEDGQVELKVHTAVVDMQKAGILALSSTCRYTEGACVQFAEELLRCAEHCFQAFLANIRCAAAELCSSIVSSRAPAATAAAVRRAPQLSMMINKLPLPKDYEDKLASGITYCTSETAARARRGAHRWQRRPSMVPSGIRG